MSGTHPVPAVGDGAVKDGWIQTAGGRKFYPLAPQAEDVCVFDISHALSNLCRYGGHTSIFYSVAQHSVHVCDMLPPGLQLAGLLHDAAEAYLVDLPSPIKRQSGFAELYAEAEDRLMRVISEVFGFSYPLDPLIHEVDRLIVSNEAAALMSPLHPDWPESRGLPNLKITPMPNVVARMEFRRRFLGLAPDVWLAHQKSRIRSEELPLLWLPKVTPE